MDLPFIGRGQAVAHNLQVPPLVGLILTYQDGTTALLLWHGMNVCMHPFLSGVPHTQAATGACCVCAVHGLEIKHPVSASAERLKQSLSFLRLQLEQSVYAGWLVPAT